ncbi:MAG TPA: NAD(P)-dependent oxidoreductase [Gemmataceae bacterium]|nr:NAD(P)-dependent oxidoreductase [Gemmataceae bacterium]
MAESLKVLVTGSAGRIGRAVVAELKARGHFVRGLDLAPTPSADESIAASITGAEEVRQAAEGIAAIVHLAATPDDDDFFTKLLPNNIVGVYHILEAARLAGVRRLVLASSGQVVWHQRFTGPIPITADVPPTPRGWYAATKVFQEAAGRAYAEAHGVSVIAARLGWVPRTREHAQELAATDWGPDVYLSPGDAGRFFAQAVEAPADFRFAVVYACSRPLRQLVYDDGPAKQRVGYEPRDVWPQGVEDLLTGERGASAP